MIIIRFGGGLGNQLYQYAFMLALKQVYPNEKFICDATSYKIFNEHNGLDITKYFDFNEEFLSVADLKKYKPIHYYLLKYRQNMNIIKRKKYNRLNKIEKLIWFLKKQTKKLKFHYITDLRTSVFNSGVLKVKFQEGVDYYFEGGWQNINYFIDFKDYIINKVKFDVSLSEFESYLCREIQNNESIAIHIRRGDYVKDKVFDLCSKNYYLKAIDEIVKITKKPINSFKLYFFTDDKEYVEKNFEEFDKIIVSSESCGVDLFLMTQCKHNIIANSTFSFWGAFLNKNNAKIVIAPKYCFYLDGMYYRLSVPIDWRTINNIFDVTNNEIAEK